MRINKRIFNYFNQLKNLYGNFWSCENGEKQYFLKLDGYFYCQTKKCTFVVIRIRNKRTAETIPVFQIVNDKNYLKEIHPFDAFVIGVLSHNERNGIIDTNCIGLKNMNRTKDYYCNTKILPILEVCGAYYNDKNIKITLLKSKFLNKQIEISSPDLCKNHFLIHSIDSLQALAVGYETSEAFIHDISR